MDNKIIEKLNDLANPNAMTSKDFIANYKIVINNVIAIKKMLATTASKLNDDFNKKKSELDTKTAQELSKIKDKGKKELANITNKLDTFEPKITKRLLELKNGINGKDGKDGIDGLNADDKKILKDVLAKIDFTDTKEDVKANKKTLSELDKKISAVRKSRVGGGTGGNNQAVQYADLTAQCNGVLKTFTIPTCRKVVQLLGTQYPVVFRPIVDYTVGNKTITLTSEVSAPESGQTLTLLYIK
jgi:hypothetical protein